MKLYALHDKKAQALSAFHVEKSDAVASRGFAEAVMNPQSVMGKYPEDFELVAIARVFEDAQELVLVDPLPGGSFEVVLTAAQVVAMRAPAGEQLSLIKEA